MVPFAAVLRPTECPDIRLFRDYHTYSRERCRKDAACTSNRFPLRLIQVTQLAIDQLLVFFGLRYDPVQLDPA